MMFKFVDSMFSRALRTPVAVCITLMLALLVAIPATAQLAGTGAISGIVSDPTGAVIPGATVTAINTDTNVKTVRTTTGSGDYEVTPLLPGPYTITVVAPGFETYKQEKITVDALATVGLNIKLTVGSIGDTVTISTAPPVLATQDATLGGVMDNEMYANLPLQMGAGGNADQRRATDFEYLMPGVQGNFTSNNSTSNSGIINGSGPAGGVSDIYIDGVDLPEADQVGDPRFTWTAIGVDAVEQFQVQTAGISSQYGGQGVQNYSIKSGTNKYHGSLYEFNRNTLFDAWQFTNKAPAINSQGVTVPGGLKPREIMNEFGIVLSGPIVKDKLFLFGNYGQYRFQQGAKFAAMTLPVAAELGYTQTGQSLGYADFTGYSTSTGANIYDPSTQTPGCNGTTIPCARTQFVGMKNGVATPNVIPGNRISAAANYYNQFLLPYQSLINQTSYSNNLTFGTPIGLANWYSTGSIDYTASTKHQVRLLIAFGRQAATGLNSGSGLLPPFNATQIYNPVTTVDMLRDTWTVTPHIVNVVAIAYGRYQSDSVTPNRQPKYAATTAGILNMPAGQASDGFPGIAWSGNFDNPSSTWGGYAWNNKINNTYNATDNLQWIKGKHNLTFGGQVIEAQFNYYKVVSPSGPMAFTFASTQTGTFSTGSSINSNSGYSVASYMLGAASSGSTSANVPGLGTRWLDPSFWVEDDWKVRSNLTLNLGVRWDIFPSVKEAHNIFTFLNPNGVNSITGNKGTLEFAGNGDPSLYCNCSSPSPVYLKNISPRLGLAWSMDPKTVFHASYDVNFARGDWTNGSQSGSPSQLGITPSASSIGGISGAPSFYWDKTACNTTNAAGNSASNGTGCGWNGSVVAPTPPAGGTSLAEYQTGNTAVLGTATASSSLTYFDPYRGSRTPEYINWGVGMQRQLSREMSISVNYVGSQGHFVSGGYSNPARTNHLTENYASLANYNISSTGAVTPCAPATCGQTVGGVANTTLLGSKYSAASLAAVQGMGFTPPNPYSNGQTYTSSNATVSYFTAFPQFAGVGDTTNFNGNTNFHALEISLRSRNTKGFDFMLNYTYSKSMDDVGTFRVYDNPRLDRSLSVTDQPENLTGTAVYQSPFGKGKNFGSNKMMNAIAGGWIISTIGTYHSGSPLAVTATGCGGTVLSTCMPSIVPGVQPRMGKYGANVVSNPASPNYYATQRYLNPAAFSVNQSQSATTGVASIGTTVQGDATKTTPATGQDGTINYVGSASSLYVPGNAARVGAYNVWSMGAYNFDFALKRTFPVYEQVKLQFEVDMLNATNHVIWGALNGGVGGSTYGEMGGPTNSARDFQISGRINW